MNRRKEASRENKGRPLTEATEKGKTNLFQYPPLTYRISNP
jgi:hypothetical protein